MNTRNHRQSKKKRTANHLKSSEWRSKGHALVKQQIRTEEKCCNSKNGRSVPVMVRGHLNVMVRNCQSTIKNNQRPRARSVCDWHLAALKAFHTKSYSSPLYHKRFSFEPKHK